MFFKYVILTRLLEMFKFETVNVCTSVQWSISLEWNLLFIITIVQIKTLFRRAIKEEDKLSNFLNSPIPVFNTDAINFTQPE